MSFLDKLLTQSHRDAQRLDNRLKRPAKLVGMLFYGGTLGLLFIVPVVGGAYLGRWLDTLASGYSVRWTISLILLGILLGGYNVFRFLQEKS
jgi:ATP synthase protein I